MGLIIKIAWRNIQRHKGKSLVIGAILFVGSLIMTFGNGVISGMDNGLRENIVHQFTGDIVLISEKEQNDGVLLDFMGKSVEPIYNFSAVRDMLVKQASVERFLPAGKNAAMVLNEDGGEPGMAFLIGVDFGKYKEMFPASLDVLEGGVCEGSGPCAMIATGAREEFFDFTNIWFIPEGESLDTANLTKDARANFSSLSVKSSAVLLGLGDDGIATDIRLPLRGVIKYRALNAIFENFVLVDIESYRRCLGYFAAADKSAFVPESRRELLELDNTGIDDLFGTGALSEADAPQTDAGAAAVVEAADGPDIEEGAYNLVFVLLKEGTDLNRTVAEFNRVFKQDSLGVRAVPWNKAMGVIGSMAMLIKAALFVFVMFLFFVAVIVIVNTLSMAALERTAEIGMMRAVGARKAFIGRMFFGETAMLSAVFGGAGIAAGAVLVRIVALFKITTTNDMVQMLFGGDVFNPMLTAGDIGVALFQLAMVTLIATLYPMGIARSITPLDAVVRE